MTVPREPARRRIPRPVLAYGLLGLIPFLAPPLVAAVRPGWADACGQVQAIYGGLILSFLGGARFAFAVRLPRPNAGMVTLSMLPTLAALAILAAPAAARPAQLLAMAAALCVLGAWDLGARGLPGWYAPLRVILTTGAVMGLMIGAWVAHG
jgi:hypothetical protein